MAPYRDAPMLLEQAAEATFQPINAIGVPKTEARSLSQNRRGLAHLAKSSEQIVPVPLSAKVLG